MTPDETRIFGQALGAIGRMQATFDDEQRAWLDDVPIERAVEEFDAYPDGTEFNAVSPGLEALDAELRLLGGEDWARLFWRLVTFRFVARTLQAPRPYTVPPSVLDLVVADLERIVELAASGSGPDDPLADADFVLDMALSRGVVIPFDTAVGQPFWITDEMEAQELGLGPGLWLQTHFRNLGQRGFSLETFHAFVPRIASFVGANPECQGWFGVTWLLDPKVSEISPHLAWYPELIRSVGAVVTPAFTDEQTIADALFASKTRRRLFEEGTYQPRDYRIVMPREAGLAWADAMAAEAGESS